DYANGTRGNGTRGTYANSYLTWRMSPLFLVPVVPTSVGPVQPMPRLSSHPQPTQGSHSPDIGMPGLQHWATRSRTCCSRGERTALRGCAGHPVPVSPRHSAGNALIPEVVPLGLAALAR